MFEPKLGQFDMADPCIDSVGHFCELPLPVAGSLIGPFGKSGQSASVKESRFQTRTLRILANQVEPKRGRLPKCAYSRGRQGSARATSSFAVGSTRRLGRIRLGGLARFRFDGSLRGQSLEESSLAVQSFVVP
jgi:hypothetical protein